jgi:hypothetical protein
MSLLIRTLTGIVSVSSSANSAIDNLANQTVELQTASTYQDLIHLFGILLMVVTLL